MTVTDDTGRQQRLEEHSVLQAQGDFARRRFRARLRRWRPILLALLALVVGVTGVWLLYFSSALAASSVDVSGNTTVPTQRIETVADVPLGTPLIKIDLAAIQARVESIPAVGSAAVSRAWPQGITIEVTERVPVAVVERSGTLQAIDAGGVLFGRYRNAPADLPLVHTPADVQATALAEAAKVVGALPASVARRVKDIDVDTVDKISLRLKGDVMVLWGSAADSDSKAEVLEVLLNKKVKEIDVSVPGRPTTTSR